MKNVGKILEIEALIENLTKHLANNNLLKIKMLYFISEYENLSIGMVIDKLGMKKSNFALMIKQLEQEGLIERKHSEFDKRCHLHQLTEMGKAQLEDFMDMMDSYFGECSKEVENAIAILTRYLNREI